MPANPSQTATAFAPIPLRARARRVLALALPIIGGMVSQNLLNLVDTAMVGRLGPEALAAVGFGSMVNWFAGSFFMGLGAGVQAIAARRMGENSPDGAVDAMHAALSLALFVVIPYSLIVAWISPHIFGLLTSDATVIELGTPYLNVRLCATVFVVSNFSFRGYWNGIGKPMVYLRTIIVIHAVNIGLNWLLIFGNLGFPKLGVRGAAIASALAVFVGTMTYIILALRYSRCHGFCKRWADRAARRNVLRLSAPAGLQNLFLSAGFVVFYRIAEVLGTREVAAANVLTNLMLVCLLPSLGFGLASATLVGQSLGRGHPREAASWGWTTTAIAVVVLLVLGLVLALFPQTWLRLLVIDAETVRIAILPLILVAALQPIDAVGNVLSQALIGAGAVRWVTKVGIGLQWGFFLPLCYLWGIQGGGGWISLWIAMLGWRTIRSGLLAWLFAGGRWKDMRV